MDLWPAPALQTREGATSTLAVSHACPLFELEFGDVGFCGGWKTGEPGEKASEQGIRTNKKLNTRMTPGWNRTHATMVGWETAPAIRAPHKEVINFISTIQFYLFMVLLTW